MGRTELVLLFADVIECRAGNGIEFRVPRNRQMFVRALPSLQTCQVKHQLGRPKFVLVRYTLVVVVDT